MRTMRRKDREKTRGFALDLVDRCGFFVMATVNPDGTPYCVPLSAAREGEWLYFHSAKEGHKIDNLNFQNKVCVACAENHGATPEKLSLNYESAVIFGTASEVTNPEEKTQALALISRRYAPENMGIFDDEIRNGLSVTGVWKIHIDEISGKGK